MAIASFIYTGAQILQTAFIIAIIIEVFRLFGSFGKSKDATAAKDWAVNAGNKLTESFEKRKERKAAEREKKLQELKELEDEKFKLGKDIANLSLSGKDEIEKLNYGLNQIKEVINRPDFNSLVSELKTRTVESMLILSESLKQKLINMRRATQKDVKVSHDWESNIERYANDRTTQDVDEELQKVLTQQTKVEENQRKEENPRWANLKRLETKFKAEQEIMKKYDENKKNYVEEIKQGLNHINSTDNKLIVIERRIVTQIDTIKNNLNSIKTNLEKLENKNIKPLDKGTNIGLITNEINKLNSDIILLQKEWEQISHANSSLINEYEEKVRKPYEQLLLLTTNLTMTLKKLKEEANQA